MKSFLLIFAVSFGTFLGLAGQAGAQTGSRVVDVRQFGAKGDGHTLDTAAIQKALDACGKAGGGTVLLPPGTYRCQPIVMRSKTTLRLEAGAILQATDNRSDYTTDRPRSFTPFLSGNRLTDIAIIGPGIIDGAGQRWWVPAEAARRKTPGYTLPRPNLVVFQDCKNVRVENVTLRNSPKFHFVPTECDGVLVSNVTVTAPPRAPNTDAIDPSGCRNVVITHCRIDVGDDNVALKAGKKVPGREFACENITVSNCTFLHGHGVSIGSGTVGGVRNLTVTHCTFDGTENGIRIKSRPGRGGLVENLTYSDITMKNVNPAITFTCLYMNSSAGDAVQPSAAEINRARRVTQKIPVYRNITISNLTATCQKSAGIIEGLADSPISNVVLKNVRISAATTGLTVRNARHIQFKDVQVKPAQGAPIMLENAQIEGLVNGAPIKQPE